MLASFVQEVANAPGTATTINLAGPPTGRVGFIGPFASGAAVHYVMEDATQAEWGVGTVTSGTPNLLARTTVIRNTAGTVARLNFTGATRVYCALPGERMVYSDAAGGLLGIVANAARVSLGAAPQSTGTIGVIGQLAQTNFAGNTAVVAPTGGTWEYLFIQRVIATQGIQNVLAGIVAGGTVINAANASFDHLGIFKRIA